MPPCVNSYIKHEFTVIGRGSLFYTPLQVKATLFPDFKQARVNLIVENKPHLKGTIPEYTQFNILTRDAYFHTKQNNSYDHLCECNIQEQIL